METSSLDKPTINIFEILNLRKERYHNAMLAWLLDPEQSHGLDDAFLSRFLERVGVKNYTRDDFQRIWPEYTLATRRLDIFIETRTHKIYIENKVLANSIDDQELKDQAGDISQDVGWDKEGIHFFIVPRPRDVRSSTQAIVDENDIRTLEWSELVELLEAIVSEDDAGLHVRVILEQYLGYAKKNIVEVFNGFKIEEMQKYVEAVGVIWQLEKGESPRRQIKKFLTLVAEEVLSKLSGVVSSEWGFRTIEDRSWAPVSWAVSFTSEDYSDLCFCTTMWYDSPTDRLLRASVGVEVYHARISQLAKIVSECAKTFSAVHEFEEDAGYYLWEEGEVQWSALEHWPSFQTHLVDRAVVWMTTLIPVIEKRLQQLQKKGRRAKK